MRKLYSILLYLAIPLIFIRLLWKSRGNPAYLEKIPERFGFIKLQSSKPILWVHAVSVGEFLGIVPMIKRLQTLYPEYHILVTTMTPTGAERVQAVFKEEVTHSYVPYDLPGAMARFLNRVKPRFVIIMETELWPNFLYACHKRDIPILLANARLSASSAAGYQRIKCTTKRMLNQLSYIAAQATADKDRFLALGMPPEKICVTGNVKFDLSIPDTLSEKIKALRHSFGEHRPVWVAASTHEGEDEIILNVFAKIKPQMQDLLLVIVPRHPERFGRVAALCEKKGYSVVLRSEGISCAETTEVFVGDSMGELMVFYGACDVAFVGGSFVNTGGHNLLEPAALGIPALTGPHVFNFMEITRLLVEAGGVIKVENPQELEKALLMWLLDENLRRQAGERGKEVVLANGGALDAHIKLVEKLLSPQ